MTAFDARTLARSARVRWCRTKRALDRSGPLARLAASKERVEKRTKSDLTAIGPLMELHSDREWLVGILAVSGPTLQIRAKTDSGDRIQKSCGEREGPVRACRFLAHTRLTARQKDSALGLG